MSDVFQEVDEELKRQHIDEAFKKYGPIVGVGAVLVVAIAGGTMLWNNYQDGRRAAAGDGLVSGMELLVQGQYNEAAAEFDALAADAPSSYATLARLREAAARRLAGEQALAALLYDAIAEDGSVDADTRDLARYFSGLSLIEGGNSPYRDLDSRLRPVVEGSGPYQFHAAEALGFAAYADGQFDVAIELFRQVTDDLAAPDGVASRANEFLNLAEARAGLESTTSPAEETPSE